ncbi:cation:proton antiporter [Virgibacillus doumboii]|uniref:cation:proton antiporter n=1 Tax=Virgibacillus doumboii TaxID=2697503 RepID=UPI0013DE7A43|nr:sodium:proton antiporter [Virgibacillus doumboii]
MEQAALLSIVVIIVLGIFSQWLAWRVQWPSIVIMSVAGLLIGPIIGLINPEEALGELYSPLISLAVAIILFESSSGLDFRELKGLSKSVFRVAAAGAFLAWIGGSLAAHYIAGLNFAISFIIGGLFIVTGPTVIIPLLRQAKLKPRVATVLKWEGIIIDPAGPLLALFAYQIIKVINGDVQGHYIINFFLGALLAVIIGLVAGLTVSRMVKKGLFPEFLKSPIVLSFVLLCFTVSEVIMHETGMLAVTVMGLTMARTKNYISAIGNVSHFVENISVMLTSTVFVLLTASLTRETIMEIFTLPILGYVLIMLFLIRPLSIWISTIGTELKPAEKTLISWIAPRGIVALTVSGYFAGILTEDGYADAAILMTLTFALVFITVCAHGFTLEPFAKKLGLANTGQEGILIVGANPFSIAFAEFCKTQEIPILIIDDSYDRLIPAQNNKGIKTYYGQILSEHTQFEVDLTPYKYILAMTDEPAYNGLICQSYAPEFGYNNTFALSVSKRRSSSNEEISPAVKGHILFDEDAVLPELNQKINEGYTFDMMEISNKEMIKKDEFTANNELLFIWKENDDIVFVTHQKELDPEKDDKAVVLRKPEKK